LEVGGGLGLVGTSMVKKLSLLAMAVWRMGGLVSI
jgi:hypothetical protein